MAAAEATAAPSARAAGAGLVLMTLAAGQFLMTLDSSVMNVSIATVAKDVGTTVTGIQGAITAYTLVMAALMITGAKVGAIIGRKRAFTIGCVIYGCGSLTTSLATSLPVLLFGWSFLEGVGAALIMPAIVALVASNFAQERRPAAYGMVAAAGAIAVAVGPLIGGFCTTYFSWRWVFAGEVVVVLAILVVARKIADAPSETRPKLDVVGTSSPQPGLGALVFGVLRSSEWGWIQPKPGGPSWAGLSPTIWLILIGVFVLWLFQRWEARRRVARPGAAHPSRLSPQPPAQRRPDHVLLPVPRAGGLLLRRAAVPLGLPRPLGARDRRAAPAALDHAAHRRDRHPAAAAGRVAAARRAHRTARAPRRARSCCSRASTPTRARRSSSCRCCSSASASAPWRRSSARSPCRRCRTTRAPRSAACRTPSRTSARRWARRSRARS